MTFIRTDLQIAYITLRIMQAKREVVEDAVNAALPFTVNTFAELHDYRDANCYGGFCDDSDNTQVLGLDLLAQTFGIDRNKVLTHGSANAAITEVQEAVDVWLRDVSKDGFRARVSKALGAG